MWLYWCCKSFLRTLKTLEIHLSLPQTLINKNTVSVLVQCLDHHFAFVEHQLARTSHDICLAAYASYVQAMCVILAAHDLPSDLVRRSGMQSGTRSLEKHNGRTQAVRNLTVSLNAVLSPASEACCGTQDIVAACCADVPYEDEDANRYWLTPNGDRLGYDPNVSLQVPSCSACL